MKRNLSKSPRVSLIINADDYCISEQVSLGILDAFNSGAITSTSVVVNMPCFAKMGKAIRDTSFDCGLHLNLTVGETVSGANLSLIKHAGPSGILNPLILSALKGTGRDKVEREISAQFSKFMDFFGKAPSHVDSHHHIHMLPPIWDLVRRKMDEFRIQFLRNSVDFLEKYSLKNTLLKLCSVGNNLGGLTEIPFTGHGLLGLQRRMALPALTSDVTVFEWMVHCGYRDAQLSQYDSYINPRQIELEFLKSSDIQTALRERFNLISFAQLNSF